MSKNTSPSDQLARFREVACQLSADESDDALDRAMDKLDLRAKLKPEEQAANKGEEK